MSHPNRAFVGDIGGSNLRTAIAEISTKTNDVEFIGEPIIEPTPSRPDPFFQSMARSLVLLLEANPELRDGVIGFPGKVVHDGDRMLVGPLTNISGLTDVFDLNERLGEEDSRLKKIRLTALNDAEAATHAAPFVPGADPKNTQPLMYFTHSTGIGADIIRGHKIASRLTGQLGEYGHIPMDVDRSKGTLESLIAGPAIERRFGNGSTPQELGQLYTHESNDAWEHVGRVFGQAIASFVPSIGMDHVVIGGGVSRDHDRYEESLEEALHTALVDNAVILNGMTEVPKVSYVPKHLVSSFGLIGARYGLEQYR
ncbi:MAG: sugar kinase [Candidatus Saccharibacteria bacterium]|nr:sugar kinase [Candidatus Saccharibacteria bacterium]